MTALPIALMTDDEVARFGRDADAGFGALHTARGALPLTAMDVDVRVTGIVAAVEVAQTFVNTSGGAIEATYIFPLPDRAAVHRFRMEVSGRVIEGVVEERGAAREQYDEAIAAGQRAAITEEERPGVFTLRVGNLMPGDTATVRLALVGPLPVDDGEVTFRFPLVVAPRYIPGATLDDAQAGLGAAADTDLVPDASRISPPVRLPGIGHPVRLGIRVALEDHGVRDVASSLHAVTTTLRDAHVVELRPGEKLDRDFILRWRADAAALASSLVCADDADGKGGTFLLTLVPPSTTALAAKPRDVVFVIDRSGSMEGWKMVAARRAAARMIDTLTSRDRFCAIAFDDALACFPGPGLVDATDRDRYRAVEMLATIEARGGTEMHAPLRHALTLFGDHHADRERVVVLVTDGQVGNEDQLLHAIAPAVRDVRMFTLGIDQAVNAGFLRRLAAAGGGLCELVESEDRLDAVMAKVHRRIGTPVATELVLRGTALELEAITPAKLPDVYAGAPVTIFGRYRGAAPAAAAIELVGTTLGEPLRVTVARAHDAKPAPWLAASWARAMIRDLEDRYAIGEREHEAAIIRISKQHGVLSRFTAFLAVDRSEIANRGGKVTSIVQPVEEPAGWEHSSQTRGGTRRSAAMPMALPMMPPALNLPASPTTIAPMQMPTGPLAAPPPPPMSPAPARVQSFAGAASMGSVRRGAPGGAPAGGPPPLSPTSPPGLPMIERQPRPEPIDAARYLAALGGLARELAQHAHGGDPMVLKRLRQRLTEWIEDVRSVGDLDTLAMRVEQLVERLSAAITRSAAGEVAAVATELQAVATGGGTAGPPRGGRVAFWK